MLSANWMMCLVLWVVVVKGTLCAQRDGHEELLQICTFCVKHPGPRCTSFCSSYWGMVVLNAEFKSRNSMSTYKLFESRWVMSG